MITHCTGKGVGNLALSKVVSFDGQLEGSLAHELSKWNTDILGKTVWFLGPDPSGLLSLVSKDLGSPVQFILSKIENNFSVQQKMS